MRYNFIVIEGNIGVGKTTLASMLNKEYQAHLILECFEKNPFLPKFYKDPEKHAFPLELFFMAERYRQLKNQKEKDLFRPITIADYLFVKSKIFAQNNLKKDELQLFNNLFEIMFSSLPKPDLLIQMLIVCSRILRKEAEILSRKSRMSICKTFKIGIWII